MPDPVSPPTAAGPLASKAAASALSAVRPLPAVGHPLSTRDLPTLNDALGALHDDLLGLRSAAELVGESAAGARQTAAAASEVIAGARTLAVPTQSLLDRVDRIDFPARLDKLDATTAALFTGLQSSQARLDTLDRALRDAHGDLARRQEKMDRVLAEHSAMMGTQAKLLWAVLASTVLTVIVLFVR